jgi:t-SNARE complex subunit (syntaxin)
MSMQQQVAQEDLVLEDMSHALERLSGISSTINTQLVEQDAQLNELDQDLDTAKFSMDNALRKMDKLLKTSDKGRLCIIVVLFILAVGLFFGVIYG